MNFKAQLISDMDQVFMNPNELADPIMIDWVETSGFFDLNGGEYEEGIPILILSASQLIWRHSKVFIYGKTYGVIDMVPDRSGGIKVTLGEHL